MATVEVPALLLFLIKAVDSLGSLTYQTGSPSELLVVRAVGTCVFSQFQPKVSGASAEAGEADLKTKPPKLMPSFLQSHKAQETVFL